MATEIRVPTLGESVTEATIGTWFKKVGDAIATDEPIVELETDKVTIEVPAPAAGTLSEILANEGDTVEVDALLGQIAEGAAAAAPAEEAPAAKEAPAAAPAAAEKSAGTDMPPAPAAAKMIAESNLAAEQVDGSGKRGQVLKGDVIDALAKGVAEPAPAVPAAARAPSSGEDEVREERVKMTRLRQTIARRLKDAQNTAAMLTTYNEVDMTAVMDLRKKYKELFEKKHGVKLGFMGFFTKAVCHALKEIPAVNAEIDGTEII
ncbi:MAG: biotin/lipoyl-containing protein, partial [Pseudomonadota bacterium]